MSYHDLDVAIALAVEAHKGQVDKAGVPYIAHICAVVSRVKTPREKVVAALHDVLEDTDVMEMTLLQQFGSEVTQAVMTLTRAENEDYNQYLSVVKSHPIARPVKIADLEHNMDLSRLVDGGVEITSRDLDRYRKYARALAYLKRP